MSKVNRVSVDKAALLKKFGERLKSLRLAHGYTNYEDFCYDSGLSRSQASNYELGKTEPRLVNQLKICKTFGITLEEFFSEGFEEKE